MALQPGTRLGSYEVLSLIGAGGMGEVYRARDTRLGREAAIKVLPTDRMADADRRRRFVQEAQAASALNHPHIVTIYEIESADGTDFIVMEYVRGKSLDALIPRQGMRLGEVLRVAIPVADALATAHNRGIIHRDLKPANVMVGSDGAVKVLDFGLAKLLGGEGSSDGETATHVMDAGLTIPGTIAGTAAYMSPEQAVGEPVDARSDIFSFGAMLYEMVTGRRAFGGGTAAGTLEAVIRAQPPPPIAIAADVPPDLNKIILRCLRKDPQRRFQHADDVKVALLDVKEESESGIVPSASVKRQRWPIVWAVTALLAGASLWYWKPFVRAALPPPRVMPLTAIAGVEASPSFSPDGTEVAFAFSGEGEQYQIHVKMIGAAESQPVTPAHVNDFAPAWSPDGRYIAFLRDQPDGRHVHVTSPRGGSDFKLSDVPVRGEVWEPALAWSPDSRYIAAPRLAGNNTRQSSGIYLLPVEGGEARQLTASKEPAYDVAPSFSPDARRLAYVSCREWGRCGLYVVRLDASLTTDGAAVRIAPDGNIGVRTAWTRDGREVVFESDNHLWRVRADGGGPPERIEIAGEAASPALSSARNRLAFSRAIAHWDVYRLVGGGASAVVLTSSANQSESRFSPDGRRIAFMSTRSGNAQIWVANADGTGVRPLTRQPERTHGSPQWSPDGRRVLFDARDSGANSHNQIWTIDAEGGIPRQLTRGAGEHNIPSWSRDGRWIYYSADFGQGHDIWRMPSAGGEPQRVTSNGGGVLFAMEAADGQSLLYSAADGPLLMLPLAGGSPRKLLNCVRWRMYDVATSGIYYVPCEGGPGGMPPLHHLNPATGEDRVLAKLDVPVGTLAVSPDENVILYDKQVDEGTNLWLIDNFQ